MKKYGNTFISLIEPEEQKVGTFMSPALKSDSSVATCKYGNPPVKQEYARDAKTKMRRIGRTKAKSNVQSINIKN
jgi:hypothetical protein